LMGGRRGGDRRRYADAAHALQFDGRKQFRVSGEMMARITATHRVEQLGRAGFVVMKKPPAPGRNGPSLEEGGAPDRTLPIAEA
jgi:hypothetical protein